VTNSMGEISLINSAAESLTGWSLEEALGKPLNSIFRLFDRKKNKGKVIPLLEIMQSEHDKVYSVPTTLERKDQTKKLITYSIALLHDSVNTVVGTILVFHDITDQTKFQEEALKANKLESIGILAGGIAHDFNNLLTAVTGNVSLLKWKTKPGEENYELLSETEDALQRVRSLTQQLLTFAKGGVPVKEVISITEILKNITTLTLRGSNVKCNFEFAPKLYAAEVDPGQFSQIIQNLIINAKQAMPKGGAIDVSAENVVHNHPQAPFYMNGDFIRIRIKDQGIGIPQEHLQNIFDPYFTTKQKGCGFGLAICYSVIKKHGGYILVNSTLGEGTAIDIYLPALQKTKIQKKERSDKLVSGQGNVLVMDDDGTVRIIAGKILKKLGYVVSLVCNGEEAIQSYCKTLEAGAPYDVVILDLTIPGEEGGEKTLEKLLEIDPGVKAIASSGYSNAAVMSNYEKYGFKGIVAKPYRITDLSQVLHEVLLS
ncbi:MAG: ATP-binding protein, partial [bacterium]